MTPVSSPLRVMHVITGLGWGGAENMLAQLLCAHRDKAPDSLVVSLTRGGGRREALEAAGIEVHDLGMRRRRPDPRAVIALRRLIRNFRPDVVQTWMYHADLLATLALELSGRRKRTALIWGVRCSDMDASRHGRMFDLVRRVCARLSSRTDCIVANAHAGRIEHVRLGYREERFVVIPNGIDVQRYRPDDATCIELRREWQVPDGMPVALVAARVDPMKGYDVLVRAAKRLPNVKFVLAGTDTQKLEVPANVLALGHCADMERIYRGADMLVSPSLYGEGFSNTIAEGMASALFPIVTDVGDGRVIVGDAGVVVPPGDVQALEAAVSECVDLAPDAFEAARQRARERVAAQFTLDTMVQAFDELHAAQARARGSA